MARDAISRLYDVQASSVVYTKPKARGKYDHGTVTFQARKGKLIDLDKLHESVWATRLSGGTSSGLVRLDVRVIGKVVADGKKLVLEIRGSKKTFVLSASDLRPESKGRLAFQKVRDAVDSGETVNLTGQIQGWRGKWPQMLSKRPASPRTILVTAFATVEE
ncbi:MAG: hypothetical protein H8E37_04695 [Planctomycetes bacterium]|nr:hypothetical protein [Planctomycetota bacterium]